MTVLDFFTEVVDNMSNRSAMVLNQMFLTRTQDSIALVLGRTTSLALITFEEEGDIARTTNLGFNVLNHPKLLNDINSEIILEDLLIIAVKNKVCAMYEPMLAKVYMSNFWEALGSHQHAINTSREIAKIGKGIPRAFP